MANDTCLVFFRSGACDLDRAAKALAGRKLTVKKIREQLAVSYPGSPIFRIGYSAEKHVAEEAAEIATRNPNAATLLPCDVRFEVEIDDLDAALDECNTLMLIQETLEEVTGGFLFNCWNGEFPGVNSNPDV